MTREREQAIKTIESAKRFAYDDVYEEAFNAAITTMRKYQKIEEIVGHYGFESSWLCLRKIREVMDE